MIGKFEDLTEQKFGNLKIIKRLENDKFGHSVWLCECICGNKIKVLSTNLKRGHTKSCGCKKSYYITHSKITHGKAHTRLYGIYNKMKCRCYNQNNPAYKNYGNRGIKICKEWKQDFENFYNWSMNNGYKEGLSIDRIDNNGNYEPNNCRWVTDKEQANNKRNNHYITYNNETHTLTEWAQMLKISPSTIYRRINRKIPNNYLLYKGKIPYKIEKESNNVK